MSWMRLGAFSLLVSFALGLGLPAVSFGQPKIPADFTFDAGKDSPGKVTFSHEKHKEKNEKCTACHTKIFKMKKGTTGPLTSAKMNAGEQCGACHNGKTDFGGKVLAATSDKAACETCHKK
jgi:c(7)-type cytochrome triheme protein